MKRKNKHIVFAFVAVLNIIANLFTSCAKFEENTLFLTDPYRILFDYKGWKLYSFQVNGLEKVPPGKSYEASFYYDEYRVKWHSRYYKYEYHSLGSMMGNYLYMSSYARKNLPEEISKYYVIGSSKLIDRWTIVKLNSRYMNMRNTYPHRDSVSIYAKFKR